MNDDDIWIQRKRKKRKKKIPMENNKTKNEIEDTAYSERRDPI